MPKPFSLINELILGGQWQKMEACGGNKKIGYLQEESFNKITALLTARRIPSRMRERERERFAKCFVWNVVEYGSERCAIKKKEEVYLEIFEMWLWRGTIKVKWTNSVRND